MYNAQSDGVEPPLNGRGYGAATDYGASPYDVPGGSYGNEYASSQGNPLRTIRRRLWIIAFVMIVLAGVAAAVSFVLTPTYRATARVIVVQGEEATASPNPNLQSEVIGLQQLTTTMAQAVDSRPVAQGVVERLGPPLSPGEVREGLEARQVAETQFIDIAYEDSDPDQAQAVANTAAEVFTEQISDLSPSADLATSATIWEQAARPGQPTSPDPVRNVLIALAAGLVLGVSLALLLGYLNDDLGSLEEAEQVSGTPVFGLIPPFKSRRRRRPQLALTGGGSRSSPTAETTGGGYGYPSERLITVLEPLGDAAEAYRVLRTNVLHAQVNGEAPKVVVTTSLDSAGGSSSICANLGVLLAQAGRRTLIVDGNLREPSLHYIFGLDNARGVVGVLAGDRDPREAYQEPFPDLGLKLKVLTSGVQPSNPGELLASGRLPQFLDGIREEFDYVLVDSPPVGLVSDSTILAAEGDGALLVLDTQQAQRKEIRRAVRGLKAVGTPVIGTILSNADERGLW